MQPKLYFSDGTSLCVQKSCCLNSWIYIISYLPIFQNLFVLVWTLEFFRFWYSTRNVNLYPILSYRAFIPSYRAHILSDFRFILSWKLFIRFCIYCVSARFSVYRFWVLHLSGFVFIVWIGILACSCTNKRPTGLNCHLSIRDLTPTSCQKVSYLYINSPIIELMKINDGIGKQHHNTLTQ